MRAGGLGLLLVILAGAAGVTAVPDVLAPGGEAVVVQVIDGDTVRLEDGREVRLVGIQAPKLPLGRPDFTAWPLAEAAKAALERLALGETVTLGYGDRRSDRHGRILAHLFTDDGLWLEGEMLERGLARVYTFTDNRRLVHEMLARERRARAAGRGIWTHAFYAIRQHDALGRISGGFAVVEGRVVDSAVVRGRGYLNFGEDYRTDFTISIAPRDLATFRREDVELSGYRGRRVRVRGWLKWLNGPMIDVTHPEQIEVLEE
ncbi:MAG: thermonuclease family protein [Alphaproteobacteria bacterium]